MSSPKNICFFNTTPFWGGGEKWHFEAAEMMSKTANNTFFVCTAKGELSKRLLPTNINQFNVDAGNFSFLNVFKLNRLVQFFKTNNITTVIFNNPKDLKLGGRAAKKAGVKNIVYRRGIAVEVKKSSLNNYLFSKVVTHFIFNSNATKALLEKHYKAVVSTKKTAIIYNAIAFPKEELVTPNNLPNSQIVIGNAGRLVTQKAQHFLLDIAQQLKNHGVSFKILIAGDGPLYDTLNNQIIERNLSKEIELLGFVDDMRSFMSKIDVFVSTAIWEGFGFVLAEAMVAKKPVLAFDMSSNPELVINGENGYLIPPQDIPFFTDKLLGLINDPLLRNKMGLAAYQFAKSNFETEKQFKKLLDFVV